MSNVINEKTISDPKNGDKRIIFDQAHGGYRIMIKSATNPNEIVIFRYTTYGEASRDYDEMIRSVSSQSKKEV